MTEKEKELVEALALIEAAGGPRKNRLVGIPRVPAYKYIPTLRMPSSRPGDYSGAGGTGNNYSSYNKVEHRIFHQLQTMPGKSDNVLRDRVRAFVSEICNGSISQNVDRTFDTLFGLVSEVVPQLLATCFASTVPRDASQGNLICNSSEGNPGKGNTSSGNAKGNTSRGNTDVGNIDESNQRSIVGSDNNGNANGVYKPYMGVLIGVMTILVIVMGFRSHTMVRLMVIRLRMMGVIICIGVMISI